MKKVIFILIMLTMTVGLFAQDMPSVRGEPIIDADKCSVTTRGIWDPIPGWVVHDYIVNIWQLMAGWVVHY
ncbi:MAG: hypothetical protein JW917_08320 [Ignavibacteria bacterium]|nr:hypothetical protein [Ignavibacteria bacterium]